MSIDERVTDTSAAFALRRTVLSAHPNVVMFFALRPVTESALGHYDHMTSQLHDCGWDLDYLREVLLAVENLVFGAALMANTPSVAMNDAQRTRYPQLADLFARPPVREPDDGFEVGFTALMEGLRTSAPTRRGGSRAKRGARSSRQVTA